MIDFIDSFLDRITMYRLVLYFLIALLAIAAVFGAFGVLPYRPVPIIFSSLLLVAASWAANGLFARAFGAEPNSESAYITALILALIITPVAPASAGGIAFLVWAAVLAMASKYLLAVNKKHIFNPAAFAVAVTAFTIGRSATWWVGGNLPMLWFVLAGGLLVTRKIRRFDLVLSFLATGFAVTILTRASFNPADTLREAILHAPFFFFAFIMLTEPLTTPPTRLRRAAYGAFVGALFASGTYIGPIYFTPELALLAGNIFSWLMSPKARHTFTLKERRELGGGIYDFAFAADRPIKFQPGQYMEWTLGHEKNDRRGNRRYFTLASSPTEREVHLGVRFGKSMSSFKRAMLGMPAGGKLAGGQLAGDFTLPRDSGEKLAFVAGGIGITPFRSMAKYLSDSGERRDAVLLYSNRAVSEIAYRDVFDEAEKKSGLKVVYAVTAPEPAAPAESRGRHSESVRHDSGASHDSGMRHGQGGIRYGRIDAKFVAEAIPDYAERTFYVSGSHAMVTGFMKTLAVLGIPKRRIKTDFFPGFA